MPETELKPQQSLQMNLEQFYYSHIEGDYIKTGLIGWMERIKITPHFFKLIHFTVCSGLNNLKYEQY